MLQSTGEFYSLSRLSGATPPPSYIISRGIGWQGIGLLFNGFWGTSTGTTVAPENVGLVGLTRVGSRRVAEISAGFMLFFSIFGTFHHSIDTLNHQVSCELENMAVTRWLRIRSKKLSCWHFIHLVLLLVAGKFGAVLASIPQPIVTAFLCINFGVVGEHPVSHTLQLARESNRV